MQITSAREQAYSVISQKCLEVLDGLEIFSLENRRV